MFRNILQLYILLFITVSIRLFPGEKMETGSAHYIYIHGDTRPIIKVEILTQSVVDKKDNNLEEILLLAQLVQAEAGNQDLTGMRYVADVVLNRVESDIFPDTVEDVIFQENQFSVIKSGGFERAGLNISDQAFKAASLEYEERLNYNVLYFGRGKSKYATNHFKYQDHWFGW